MLKLFTTSAKSPKFVNFRPRDICQQSPKTHKGSWVRAKKTRKLLILPVKGQQRLLTVAPREIDFWRKEEKVDRCSNFMPHLTNSVLVESNIYCIPSFPAAATHSLSEYMQIQIRNGFSPVSFHVFTVTNFTFFLTSHFSPVGAHPLSNFPNLTLLLGSVLLYPIPIWPL